LLVVAVLVVVHSPMTRVVVVALVVPTTSMTLGTPWSFRVVTPPDSTST
jgi:hypothetical protein